MMLLNRVIAVGEDTLCAEVRIQTDSLFCAGGGVGSWVGLEYMAQAIGAYVGYRAYLRAEPVKIGFLLGTRRYECSRGIFPVGAVLQVHVRRILQNEDGMASFECRIADETGQLATANLTVYQPPDGTDFPERSPA
jgi:predicted hotdog family 3-hydroxylacyl-ACP dehydratase